MRQIFLIVCSISLQVISVKADSSRQDTNFRTASKLSTKLEKFHDINPILFTSIAEDLMRIDEKTVLKPSFQDVMIPVYYSIWDKTEPIVVEDNHGQKWKFVDFNLDWPDGVNFRSVDLKVQPLDGTQGYVVIHLGPVMDSGENYVLKFFDGHKLVHHIQVFVSRQMARELKIKYLRDLYFALSVLPVTALKKLESVFIHPKYSVQGDITASAQPLNNSIHFFRTIPPYKSTGDLRGIIQGRRVESDGLIHPETPIMPSVISHELIHLFFRSEDQAWQEEWKKAQVEDGEKFISPYAATSAIEDIAETGSFYIITGGDPNFTKGLRQDFPNRFAFMDRVFGVGTPQRSKAVEFKLVIDAYRKSLEKLRARAEKAFEKDFSTLKN